MIISQPAVYFFSRITSIKQNLLFLSLLLLCLSCTHAQKTTTDVKYAAHVGDIAYDAALDKSNFHICDSAWIFQYYNTGSYYKDNKDSIRRYFMKHYKPAIDARNQSGYITVKFIINCEGVTGRFRVFEMDSSYRAFSFNSSITTQLLTLTKGVKGWKPARYQGEIYDSYQYITFRLRNGKIISISP